MEELVPQISIIAPKGEDREGEIMSPSAKIRPLLLPLRKKSEGRSIYVSKFLCPISGHLALNEEKRARTMFGGNQSFSDNALRANRMKLSPGGKCPPMRWTTWGDGVHQDMTFPEDYADKDLRGKPKGIKIVPDDSVFGVQD
ncbi:unnamed protein product [Albugo candida]|uniref:Uncharacterized protein n=1 Tax=Albugo candida TaxID=65357 RepID=A0A024G683_9STRA|nr:unnamed protein product [Albugo candida]|eukprot:CCI41820.1 unnamed protein product [Albugo candida]